MWKKGDMRGYDKNAEDSKFVQPYKAFLTLALWALLPYPNISHPKFTAYKISCSATISAVLMPSPCIFGIGYCWYQQICTLSQKRNTRIQNLGSLAPFCTKFWKLIWEHLSGSCDHFTLSKVKTYEERKLPIKMTENTYLLQEDTLPSMGTVILHTIKDIRLRKPARYNLWEESSRGDQYEEKYQR